MAKNPKKARAKAKKAAAAAAAQQARPFLAALRTAHKLVQRTKLLERYGATTVERFNSRCSGMCSQHKA